MLSKPRALSIRVALVAAQSVVVKALRGFAQRDRCQAQGLLDAAMPVCAVLILSTLGCARFGCASDHLGAVQTVSGDVSFRSSAAQRPAGAAEIAWKPVQKGRKLFDGDGIKTATGATSIVAIEAGGNVEIGPESIVYFKLSHSESGEAFALDVSLGEAVLQTASSGMRLETSIGRAQFSPDSRVRFSSGEGATAFEVEAGTAVLQVGDQAIELQTEIGLARFAPGTQLRMDAVSGDKANLTLEIGEAVLNGELVEAGRSFAIDVGQVTFAAAKETDELAPPLEDDAPDSTEATAIHGFRLEVEGAPLRLRAPGTKTFVSVPVGIHEAEAGSVVRLGSRGSSLISTNDAVAAVSGPAELTLGDSDGVFASASRGRVEVTSSAEGQAQFGVKGGNIVLEAGSQSLVQLSRTGALVRNRKGAVAVVGHIDRAGLGLGEHATLFNNGRIDQGDKPPDRVALYVVAGESFTLRDPSPPSAVGFRLKRACGEGGGLVELKSGARTLSFSSKGSLSVHTRLGIGIHAYRVRCFKGGTLREQESASGRIRVLRDSGKAQLPRSAPSTRVDTDGRNYTVLYQNLLPEIRVNWPKAPAASEYTLTAKRLPGGTPEVFSSAKPSHVFSGGDLREGRYAFTYSSNTGKTSKSTTLVIDFDNAAPKASITSPAQGSATPGTTVEVAGVAMAGWSVAVEGKPIPMAAKHRFSTPLTVGTETDAISIRLAHPVHGVHYYLRHTSKQ